MLSERMSLGIAQTVFYVPAVTLAMYLFWRNGMARRPRMAWWPLIPLTLMRLVGGIITIILEEHPSNIGLIIAAIVLLNVGAIPLIVLTLGQIRIVFADNYGDDARSRRIVKGLRLSLVAATILLVTGGSLSDVGKNISRLLSLVGYILFAIILAVLIAMELYFFARRYDLTPTSRKVLRAALLAAPFLILRTVYGILGVCFEYATHNVWSPIFGSVYAFAFMGLLTEYIPISTYFWLGFSMQPDRGLGGSRGGDQDSAVSLRTTIAGTSDCSSKLTTSLPHHLSAFSKPMS